MKIKLIRTGGMLPLTKMAETETDMNSAELAELIGLIRADPAAPRVKDGFTYKLVAGRKTFLINMDKIPAKYRGLFDKLKSGLKIVK